MPAATRLSLWLPLAALSRGNPTRSHWPLSSGFPALRLQPGSGATLSSSADPCRRRQPRGAVLATGKFEPEVEDVHFPHFPVLAVRGPDNRRARARGGGGGPPGRSVAPASGSLHPFEGKKCQGLRGSGWELRSAGTLFPPSCTCAPSRAAQLWRQMFLVVVAAGSGIPREGRSAVEWQPLRSPEPAAVGRAVLSAFLAPGSPKGREHLQCP